MSMIEIDGSYGEGGGSIVRLAVAFSAVTGKAVKIYNIRSKREKQGLQAQHLTAVNAVAKLSNAEIKNAFIGSKEIEFYPSKINSGAYNFDIGTAGSIALVLQSLMIPAIHASGEIKIKIKGGTYVRKAPSIGYLQNVTLPLLEKLGYNAEIKVERHGFYPKGGGIVEIKIKPKELRAITLIERGELQEIKGYCFVSNILRKRKVAERIKNAIEENITKLLNLEAIVNCEYVDTLSAGCGIDLIARYENSILGSSMIGEIKKTSEQLALEVVYDLIRQHKSNATLDEHMTDQILPYLVLAKGKSKVTVSNITSHAKTNIWLLEKFVNRKFYIHNNIIEVE